MSYTLRSGLTRALTHDEMDDNWAETNITAVRRSLNVADTAVINATDAVTVLDGVSHIYDDSTQTTWCKPSVVGAGETIVGVSGSTLVTSAGTYELIKITSATREEVSAIITHPSIPSTTDDTKLIMRPSGETGFYVVTKRARGRGGYIMRLVRDDVAAADADNTGGASNSRLSVVNNCVRVYVAHSVADNTSGDVTQLNNSAYVDEVWRYSGSGAGFSYFSESEDTSASNLQNRKLYKVNSGTGAAYAEFLLSGDSTLHLGLSATSSESVEIQVLDASRLTLYTQQTVSLRKSVSSPGSSLIIPIYNPAILHTSNYVVRVVNKSVNVNEPCYIAGLNIQELSEIKSDTSITNAVALRSSSHPKYRASSGANEFAAREYGGKLFGTYHGGHDKFFERLRTRTNDNWDIQADAVPPLLVTDHVTLYSSSRIKSDSGTYSYAYVLTVRFSDGLDIATQSISVTGGYPLHLSDVYTHMCGTYSTFTSVLQPVYIPTLTLSDTPLANTGYIEQTNNNLTMAGYFSVQQLSDNIYNGAYIQDTTNFNKQYYGPIVGGSSRFYGGTYITAKEYF